VKKPVFSEAKKRTKEEIKIIRDGYSIPVGIKNIGKEKKYYIETYGCQMNVHDSETISAILEDMNYIKAINKEESDLIILNTCSIRENAHNKVFGMLGRLKHSKKSNNNLLIGLCGCMAQEEKVIDEILKKYKWLDFVFGTHNIHELPHLLEKAINKKGLELEVWSKEGDIIENMPIKRDSKYKAWVNIMYGCDKFCTYCIVPYVRGKQRSRRPHDIINEVKLLIEQGYKEITLLGQNVNAYGKDFLDKNYNMVDLLEEISKLKIERIRFITSHPWDFSDEMINIIKNNPNIMPAIHLPIQSGSNKILKLMGRRYTKEEYIILFNKLKNNIPNINISTDIIVGFPGETEEDFQETLDLYNVLKFDFAFTFIFSPREGTPASKFEDNVLMSEKSNRLHLLNELVNKYALESNKNYLEKTVKVLIEGKDEKNNKFLTGYTETNKLVNIVGDDIHIGEIAYVKITDAKTWSLSGEIINE